MQLLETMVDEEEEDGDDEKVEGGEEEEEEEEEFEVVELFSPLPLTKGQDEHAVIDFKPADGHEVGEGNEIVAVALQPSAATPAPAPSVGLPGEKGETESRKGDGTELEDQIESLDDDVAVKAPVLKSPSLLRLEAQGKAENAAEETDEDETGSEDYGAIKVEKAADSANFEPPSLTGVDVQAEEEETEVRKEGEIALNCHGQSHVDEAHDGGEAMTLLRPTLLGLEMQAEEEVVECGQDEIVPGHIGSVNSHAVEEDEAVAIALPSLLGLGVQPLTEESDYGKEDDDMQPGGGSNAEDEAETPVLESPKAAGLQLQAQDQKVEDGQEDDTGLDQDAEMEVESEHKAGQEEPLAAEESQVLLEQQGMDDIMMESSNHDEGEAPGMSSTDVESNACVAKAFSGRDGEDVVRNSAVSAGSDGVNQDLKIAGGGGSCMAKVMVVATEAMTTEKQRHSAERKSPQTVIDQARKGNQTSRARQEEHVFDGLEDANDGDGTQDVDDENINSSKVRRPHLRDIANFTFIKASVAYRRECSPKGEHREEARAPETASQDLGLGQHVEERTAAQAPSPSLAHGPVVERQEPAPSVHSDDDTCDEEEDGVEPFSFTQDFVAKKERQWTPVKSEGWLKSIYTY